MTKVDLKTTEVAWFDDERVPRPGFYVVEGDTHESEVKIRDGGEWADDEFREFTKRPKVVKTVTVTHNSTGEPGDQVFPCADGNGWQTDDPNSDPEDEEGGDE